MDFGGFWDLGLELELDNLAFSVFEKHIKLLKQWEM